MLITFPRYARAGFLSRSINEFKRLSKVAINLETLDTPTKPYSLIKFDNKDKLDETKLMSDADQSGFTKASLTWNPPINNEPFHIKFHGNISTKLPPTRPDIQRSGYAAFRTKDMGRTIFGETFWDMDQYKYLAIKLKSDGRRYHVNLQSDTLISTDIHQHRLYTNDNNNNNNKIINDENDNDNNDKNKNKNKWETILLSFDDFVRTNHGMPVEPMSELMKNKLKSVGIGLIDRIEGPFEICISEIYATN